MVMASDTELLSQILQKQGEITGQLGIITSRLETLPDHETRLRVIEAGTPPNLELRLISLENFRSKLTGFALAASLFGGVIGGVVEHVLQHI